MCGINITHQVEILELCHNDECKANFKWSGYLQLWQKMPSVYLSV